MPGHRASRSGQMGLDAAAPRAQTGVTKKTRRAPSKYDKPRGKTLRRLRVMRAWLLVNEPENWPPSLKRCDKMVFSSLTAVQVKVRLGSAQLLPRKSRCFFLKFPQLLLLVVVLLLVCRFFDWTLSL